MVKEAVMELLEVREQMLETHSNDPISASKRSLRLSLQPLMIHLTFAGLLGPENVKWRRLYGVYQLVIFGWIVYLGYSVASAIQVYLENLDPLHAFTVGAILLGWKPVVLLINLAMFRLAAPDLHQGLKLLEEEAHKAGDWVATKARQRMWGWLAFAWVGSLLILVVGIAEGAVQGLSDKNWANLSTIHQYVDGTEQILSLIWPALVNLETLLPLTLYAVLYGVTRDTASALEARIRRNWDKNNNEAGRRSLGAFYSAFLAQTKAQSRLSDALSLWTMGSLAWATASLCLAVYFASVTKIESILTLPDSLRSAVLDQDVKMRDATLRQLKFHVAYATWQMGIVFLHLAAICWTATRVNEATRGILSAVLDTVPTNEQTPEDRFQMTAFVHKMSSQYQWGASCWRVFLLERSSLLTILSLTISYVILLFKFRGSSDKFEFLRNETANHLV